MMKLPDVLFWICLTLHWRSPFVFSKIGEPGSRSGRPGSIEDLSGAVVTQLMLSLGPAWPKWLAVSQRNAPAFKTWLAGEYFF